jgi:hypothetical protein
MNSAPSGSQVTDGYDIHTHAKIKLDISDPALKIALEYCASRDGFSTIEAFALEQLRCYVASEDSRFD